ncbi:hypothetical protein [Methanofollis fontis]|uniref:Uncharacterized protein n=1 Tax=Methanofollis fontis TaxID=2052832 RepID=A0A483CRC8_9EURY|nr:hypothetical protein [Methanofollis fontis]TAJ43554.1 hypothetical protein CUJ86_10515 [Methanofollis fontis]
MIGVIDLRNGKRDQCGQPAGRYCTQDPGRPLPPRRPDPGKHLPDQAYPPGFRYYPEDGEGREYPFAGPYTTMPADTLGSAYEGRSAAVGSRSTLTHVYAGTDITVECFARNLYNYGTMAAVRRDKNEQWRGIQ